MAVFFDTHAHLDHPDFNADFSQVLERAQEAGVTRIISIGTDIQSSKHAIELAERYDCIYAVVGWHPSNANDAPADIRNELSELVKHPKVVAIGETGLDYYRLPSSQADGNGSDDDAYKRKQAQIFQQQLEVAAKVGLNCVIHQRGDCFEDTLAMMKPYAGRLRGVFHCFAGDADAMRRVLAIDSIVSFTGIVTFKNGQNVRDTVAAAPMGSFMLETDCPYLAPVPYRGKRCEPSYVKEIAETIISVKGCSIEELSRATCETASIFFPKMKPIG